MTPPTAPSSSATDPSLAQTADLATDAEASGHGLFLRVFPSICLPMFLAAIDQTIVATALPNIAAELGNVEQISWVVVSYLVAGTIAAPAYGRLGDILGRRRMLFTALGVFVVASVLCAVAPPSSCCRSRASCRDWAAAG